MSMRGPSSWSTVDTSCNEGASQHDAWEAIGEEGMMMLEACGEGRLEEAKLLAEHHPTLIEWCSTEGHTAAHVAAFFGQTKVLAWLARKAPHLLFTRTEDGETPAHAAASQGQVSCIKLLATRWRGLVCEADSDGWTPAHAAACYAQSEVLVALMQIAPDLFASAAKNGQLPADVAANRAIKKLIALLQEIREIEREEGSISPGRPHTPPARTSGTGLSGGGSPGFFHLIGELPEFSKFRRPIPTTVPKASDGESSTKLQSPVRSGLFQSDDTPWEAQTETESDAFQPTTPPSPPSSSPRPRPSRSASATLNKLRCQVMQSKVPFGPICPSTSEGSTRSSSWAEIDPIDPLGASTTPSPDVSPSRIATKELFEPMISGAGSNQANCDRLDTDESKTAPLSDPMPQKDRQNVEANSKKHNISAVAEGLRAQSSSPSDSSTVPILDRAGAGSSSCWSQASSVASIGERTRVGVGLYLRRGGPEDCRLRVKSLVAGGPAHRSEMISVGDEIVSICGENVKTRRLAEVAAMLVGPVGSTVECAIIKKLPYEAQESGEELVVSLERGGAWRGFATSWLEPRDSPEELKTR